MTEMLHLLTTIESHRGGWGGWQSYTSHDIPTTGMNLTSDSLVTQNNLVKVRERLWF